MRALYASPSSSALSSSFEPERPPTACRGVKIARLVWACGEHFSNPRLSIGSELLRFGFKEWAGIRDLQTLRATGPQGRLTEAERHELCLAASLREGDLDLPIVICRDTHVLPALMADTGPASRVTVTYLGAAASPSQADGLAPERVLRLAEASAKAQQDRTHAEVAAEHIAAIERHLLSAAPARWWLVIRLDHLRLGRAGAGWIDEPVAGALLQWTQSLRTDCSVMLLSGSRATPASLLHISHAARTLGQAMHRRVRSLRAPR
jgi:hypothetical protein